MLLIWILRPEVSGVGARVHILMLEYFTQLPVVTTPSALHLLKYTCHEDVKKLEHCHQVRDIEHGVFTPYILHRIFSNRVAN